MSPQAFVANGWPDTLKREFQRCDRHRFQESVIPIRQCQECQCTSRGGKGQETDDVLHSGKDLCDIPDLGFHVPILVSLGKKKIEELRTRGERDIREIR